MPLLLDTGPLYALTDKAEKDHKKIKIFFENQNEVMILPWVILPELAYLLHERLGDYAELAFINSVNQKELTLEGVHEKDLERAQEIMKSYPDFGFVDSTVMAMAERLKIGKIVTFDHRDYGRFTPKHCPYFTLLP